MNTPTPEQIQAARRERRARQATRARLAAQAHLDRLNQRRSTAATEASARVRRARLNRADAALGDWRQRLDQQITRCPICDIPTFTPHTHRSAA